MYDSSIDKGRMINNYSIKVYMTVKLLYLLFWSSQDGLYTTIAVCQQYQDKELRTV
jgi:hypothetical protein